MVGERKQGDGSDDLGRGTSPDAKSQDRLSKSEPTVEEDVESAIKIEVLTLTTSDWTGQVLPIWEMPHEAVIDMMGTEGSLQMIKTVDLFKLAIVDPKEAEKIDGLSFRAFSKLLTAWSVQSAITEPE